MLFKDTPSRPRARTLSSQLEEYSNNPLFTLKGSSAPLLKVTTGEELSEPLSDNSQLGKSLQNVFGNNSTQIVSNPVNVPLHVNNYPSTRSTDILTGQSNSHSAPNSPFSDRKGTSTPPTSTNPSSASMSSTMNTYSTSTPSSPTVGLKSSTPKAESGHKPLPSQVHLISRPVRASSSPSKPQAAKNSKPKDSAYPNYSPMQHQYGTLQSAIEEDE